MEKSKLGRFLSAIGALATSAAIGLFIASKNQSGVSYEEADALLHARLPLMIVLGVLGIVLVLIGNTIERKNRSEEQREKAKRISVELWLVYPALMWLLGGYFYFASKTELNVTFRYASNYDDLRTMNILGLCLMIAGGIVLFIAVIVKFMRAYYYSFGSFLSGILLLGFGVFALTVKSDDVLWDYATHESEMMHTFGALLLVVGAILLILGFVFLSMKKRAALQVDRPPVRPPQKQPLLYDSQISRGPSAPFAKTDSAVHTEPTAAPEPADAPAQTEETADEGTTRPVQAPDAVRFDYCPFCGAKAAMGSNYCNICGRALPK